MQKEELTDIEKQIALQILQEYATTGISASYNALIDQDYDEIPVNIDTFLHDEKYLGKGLTSEEGKFTVFPYWVNTLEKIFPDPLMPAQYNTLALTGGIGLGKSFAAVLVGLYELYRMLCLKNPYTYYGMQPIDKISFAVINITMEAAKGVAWDKMQSLIQSSPWFMEHGEMKGRTHLEWVPPKGIELIAGSLIQHIRGRALFFCLDGDTKVLTTEGIFKIKDLQNKAIKVFNIDKDNNICISDECTVLPTAIENTEIQIELEDGSLLKCTPTHRFMLKDGTYKCAKDLTENDELADFSEEDLKQVALEQLSNE